MNRTGRMAAVAFALVALGAAPVPPRESAATAPTATAVRATAAVMAAGTRSSSGGTASRRSGADEERGARPMEAVTRLLEQEAPQPAAGEGTAAENPAPRAWVLPEAEKASSVTGYDVPAPPERPAGTRISLSSDSLFGDGPLAWRLLLEGRRETGVPEVTFRGAAWRFFRGSRDAWWLGMETDDTGENRATFSLEYAF